MQSTIINGHARARLCAVLNISLISNHACGNDSVESPTYCVAKNVSSKRPQHRYQAPVAKHHYRSAKQRNGF